MFAYSPETIAIGFIVVLVIGAIIFMIVLLIRILSEAQGGYQLVAERTYEISQARESLDQVMGSLGDILIRLKTLKSTQEKEPATQRPLISPEAVKSLERLTEALSAVSLRELEQLMIEMRSLLAGIQGVTPEAYPQWIGEHRLAIERVLQHEAGSEKRTHEIREVIDETRPLIEHWVLEAKLAEKEALSEEMAATFEQQEILLTQARSRADEAEHKLATLRQQVENLLSQQSKKRSEDKEELERIRQENAQLSNERTSLIRHLENLSNEIKRTRLEKKFIEDRFVDMDEQSRQPVEEAPSDLEAKTG